MGPRRSRCAATCTSDPDHQNFATRWHGLNSVTRDDLVPSYLVSQFAHDIGLISLWMKTRIENWCLKMLPQNSPQSVAAAVPRSPELTRALDDSAAAQAKEKGLHAEIAQLNRKRANLLKTSDVAVIDVRLEAICAELRSAETAKRVATRSIQDHQTNYSQAVRAALSRQRRDAASRVVASIAELTKAAADLDATAAAIIAAGGRARRLPPVPLIDGIAKVAHMIERES